MGYLGTKPSNQTPTFKQVYEYTATAGQTAFSASYTPGFVDVYRNGVKLGSSDFTATNGTSVTLAASANSGDFVQVVSLFNNSTLNAIPNTAGAVSTSNIADSNVTTAKIADANVTQAKLASGVAGTGPAFSAYNSSNISCSTGTSTKIVFDTERFDTNNCYNSSTGRFTPTVAGYYQFNAAVYSGDAPGTSFIKIQKNGSDYTRGAQIASANYQFTLSVMIYLNGTTDYVECYFDNNKGSTITINSYSFTNNFDGCLVRAA